MRADELWFSDDPKARTLRTVLTPLSWLYAAGWQAYLSLYSIGLKKAKETHKPVICVGNLTVGGSGKTPVTLHLYDLLSGLGLDVTVSCSGYGSEGQHGAAIAPEGELVTSLWGDEAAMLRWLRPGMKLIVGRDRVAAAKLVAPESVLLLDDGFQHLPLKKHISIILDERVPRNKRCLPAGPYREPRSNRDRADLLLPGAFEVLQGATSFLDPTTETPAEVGPVVQVLCALGRPDRFKESLQNEGLKLGHMKLLGDHDPLDAGTLFDGFASEIPIVVTAKDWVKLRRRSDLGSWTIRVAMQIVRIEPADQFREFLHATLSKIR